MSEIYLSKSRLGSITFASEVSPRKIKKNINVKGFLRKGKFVRAFNRKQDVREKVVKVAVASLAVLGTALGVGVASAALTKVRYNRNLVNFGRKLANNIDEIPDMKIPKGLKKIPRPHKTNKDSMTFFIGGLEKFETAQGEKLMKSVRSAYAKQGRPIDKKHELIPLFHSTQVRKSDVVNTVEDIYDTFKTAAVKGRNEDSIIMAKEIYKWHKLNPDKPINIITASAGGFQSRDISHILEAAGVDTKKLIKVFNTATPDYGLVDEIVPTLKVMHSDDLYSKTFPNVLNKAGLPSLFRGKTVFLGKGDTPTYREMISKKRMLDAKAGREYNAPTDYEMPLMVHLTPAYFNGETKTSKKTLHYLHNFMFKNQ